MPKLTFYGGVDEIGGNKILLEEGNTKVFLDFGMSFSEEGKFFEFPLLRPTNIDDLRKINVLPELEGLYKNAGLKVRYLPNGDFFVEETPEERKIDAIILSHGHLDHTGYLGLVRPDIPIYSSAATKKFLKLRSDINKNWAAEASQESFNTVEVDEERQIGKDLTIRRFDVDHSIVGASAYLICTKNKKIAYTGDFRFHGYRQKETEYFQNEIAKENIDVLITEGTRLSRKDEEKAFDTEEEVFEACCEFTKKEKGLVIYDASPADIDRVKTLSRVAKETGRELVLDDKKAYFVLYLNHNEQKNLVEDLPNIDDFKIYLSREKLKKTSKKFTEKIFNEDNLFVENFIEGRSGHQKILLAKQIMESKKSSEDFFKAIKIPDKKFLWGPLGRQEILSNPGKYILYTSNGPLTLLQFVPAGKKIEGSYIYGKAEPFNEEMEFSHDILENWIKLAGLNMKYAHTSGHASADDLKKFIQAVKPKLVMPVHTENAAMFEKFGAKILRPELKKIMEL
ncbi:MAG: MBL fold metallo-hydrolase [Elusimicrobia bacterium]|nr:MBL fold metallo-hydrolase [Elusimicrobiota bacterium]